MTVRRMYWLLPIVVILLVMLVALSACNAMPPETSATTPGGDETASAEAVLTRAMTSEPASLDPHGPASSGLSLVLPYLFDTLVTRDVDNTIVPLLAESWETSADGRTITMTLKSDVTFHDGTPMNAEAVKYSFDRFKEIGKRSPIYSGIVQIDSGEAIDDTTAVFKFAEPTATFWSTLSTL